MSQPTPYPVTPVILSGGSGTRLWPLSRRGYPKQFLPLADHRTLFASTLDRAMVVPGATAPLVVANTEHRFLAAEQLRHHDIKDYALLLEPCSRNTAPAITAAAYYILRRQNESPPLMLVLPADHVIADTEAFSAAVEAGVEAAASGYLVTFGIRPDRPETGFGYIRAATGRPIGKHAYEVERFVEKPDAATAAAYLAAGDYTWNSGMFLLRPDVFLDELRRLEPAIAECAGRALDEATSDFDFIRLDDSAFAASPAASVDYAVMEHTDRAAVVPLECGWSDVGAWSALWELAPKDDAGNLITGDVISVDSRNNYVRSEHRLVATVGVSDLVIVETPDAVLIADRTSSQDVRRIVDRLIAEDREEAELHREVHRPWGTFDCIDQGDRFKVKRITVNPGEQISLQKHFHRAEHWVVVRGTAEITRDDEVLVLTENESTFIPLGSVHRLGNPGKVPLEIIEVQSGKYLGEDDIQRMEDDYRREPQS